jgi:cobalamin biosynthesis Mg chelatase CobN
MNTLIPLLLSLLETAAPALGGPAVQRAVAITAQLVPILLETGSALLPRLKNIIAALRGNAAITPDMLADLDAAEATAKRITETFVLDGAMRERLASLNSKSASRVANRLLEACDRNLWTPDAATLAALRDASDELEDRLEGVMAAAA